MGSSLDSPRRMVGVGFALILGALLLLHFDDVDGRPGPVGRTVGAVVAPFQNVWGGWGKGLRGLWLDYVGLWDVRKENLRLGKRVISLEARSARVDELEAENLRLSQLLEFAEGRKDLRLSPARVVSRSNSALFRVMGLTIDAAQTSQLAPGQPVLSAGGVVGQVRTVTEGRAEVLLLTDPRSAVDVMLEQSRARGLAIGTGDPQRYSIRLEYLERNARVVPGERVLTTGDDGVFPRGLYLGSVVLQARDGARPFRRAEIRPGVDPSTLEEVLIVLGPSGLSADGKRFQMGKGKP